MTSPSDLLAATRRLEDAAIDLRRDLAEGWAATAAHSRLISAIAAWQEAAGVGGWRDIKEAPQNGSAVDLWVDGRSIGLGHGPARIPDCWHSIGKWWRYDENGDGQCRSEVVGATHFSLMLPPPPADGAKNG